MFIENLLDNRIYDPLGSNTLFRIRFYKHTTSLRSSKMNLRFSADSNYNMKLSMPEDSKTSSLYQVYIRSYIWVDSLTMKL